MAILEAIGKRLQFMQWLTTIMLVEHDSDGDEWHNNPCSTHTMPCFPMFRITSQHDDVLKINEEEANEGDQDHLREVQEEHQPAEIQSPEDEVTEEVMSPEEEPHDDDWLWAGVAMPNMYSDDINSEEMFSISPFAECSDGRASLKRKTWLE
ncbi:hypothetical protein HID58_080203 [Brassica napus]|uniref:Uncharacterized protein n=1 Tax=Brassica napus TaxID=3708 RepID=A0ABQ7Y5W5_BRANA|nr:hypothetical protein HID58_080203 [Brassica napus]